MRDVIIDVASGKRVCVGEQPQPPPADGKPADPADARLVKATLRADGLHLSGIGCDQVIAVGAGGAAKK